jgi:glycosyltransferase involved in cell wall biosynthesis
LNISLVVPVKDEAGSVRDLLESLAAQTAPPDEVVVVDGGSTDGTPDLVEGWARAHSFGSRIRALRTPQAFPGKGRNLGIAAARHEWVALTDAGIRLEPDWVERLAEIASRDPGVDVVYGNYEPVPASFFERCAALTYVAAPQMRGGRLMRGPSIASCLIHRRAWEAVGGFPDLRAAEDLIFMERVASAGFRAGWAPAATVHWRLQPTLGRTFRKFALYSKHNVWAGRQGDWHYGVARAYLLSALFLVPTLFHSAWWLAGPVVLFAARVAKSIWRRGGERWLGSLLDPRQFVMVSLILFTIDLATFVGWAQALCRHPIGVPVPVAEEP